MKRAKLSEAELSYRMLNRMRAAGVALNEILKRRGVRSVTLEHARLRIEEDWRKAMGAYLSEQILGGTEPDRN